VFEEWEHARARGADILAEVVGFAMTSDASDIVMPSKQGAARAMAGALRDAGLAPEAVGYINAHGTGTTANDKTECAAVADVFGQHADRLMISSTKSMHGHLIGGTGAVELLACLMALRDGVIAPTIGHEEADPECALDVVPNQARDAQVEVCLSNAFAFGGMNAVIALGRGCTPASGAGADGVSSHLRQGPRSARGPLPRQSRCSRPARPHSPR
jgi:nodulation protein E